MWHLQLRKWLSISAFGHLCILCALFVIYRGNEPYHILVTGTMINTDVPIVFLPMHKTLMQKGGQKKSTVESSPVKSTVETVAPTKKGTVAVALPDRNPSRRLKAPQDEKVKKNKKNKKEVKSNKSKKESPKPVEDPSRRIKDAPQDEKKLVEAEKKPEPPQPVRAEALEASIIDASLNTGDPVLYVGQQEMDALQMQDYIQQEMAQHWSPPAGMRKDISCIIKVMIGFDGVISTIEIAESSGVFIFDGAAKRAAAQLTPPQWAYGKEILLTFKP